MYRLLTREAHPLIGCWLPQSLRANLSLKGWQGCVLLVKNRLVLLDGDTSQTNPGWLPFRTVVASLWGTLHGWFGPSRVLQGRSTKLGRRVSWTVIHGWGCYLTDPEKYLCRHFPSFLWFAPSTATFEPGNQGLVGVGAPLKISLNLSLLFGTVLWGFTVVFSIREI